MRHHYLTFCLLLSTVSAAVAQSYTIKGRVTDRASGETLPGTSVIINGSSQGGVTDGNGSFTIANVKPGSYTLKASYIGYTGLEQKVTVTTHDENVSFRLAEDNNTLNEVEVVAQVAVERETPVAFSSVNEVKLRESLAGRDLPMILNETPGVYASQGTGGAGDSQISIRGFDQRNVAVMINGVPVNDMESGAVFWSNWDLGDVTKNLQVQRGLTASKLAVPSVGGTINVLTKGFDAKRGGRVRQEFGYNGYRKTSLMLSSGQLKGDWAVTVFGSRRVGNGWIDGLYDDAWTYFGNISKRFGKHQLSLTGLGSPQKHGTRIPFGYNISRYSEAKAKDFGDLSNQDAKGFRFNQDWNMVNRYKLNADGSRSGDNYEQVNSQANYYHKPQVNLNHFWNASDRLFVSNVVYGSMGTGGGVQPYATPSYDSTGRVDLQKVYDQNIQRHEVVRTYKKTVLLPNNTTRIVDSTARDAESLASNYLLSSVNNHKWVGFITSADYKLNDNATLSAGIDGRYYRGEHYREIYDLLGGDYALDVNVSPSTRTTYTNPGVGDQYNANPYRKLRVGDKYDRNYDGITKWLGGYSQLEYKKGPLSGFVSGTFSMTTYQRIDYYRGGKYVLPNGQTVLIGNGLTRNDNSYYTNSPAITVAKAGNYAYPTAGFSPTDTTIQLSASQPTTYAGQTYYRVDMTGKTPIKSDVVRLPGFTAKTGINYNLTEDNNIFFNIGYLNRAQFFRYVFDATGARYKELKNEGVFSVELGYAISRQSFKAALNAYRTAWYNRSTNAPIDDPRTGLPVSVNVTGLNTLHQGVELDIAQEITRQLSINSAFSIGDWRYQSAGTTRIVDDAGAVIATGKVNLKGVHVGGAAQNQFMIGLRYEPLAGFYLRPTFTLFSKYYANFDPSAAASANPQDAYRLPTYRNVDLHSGYSREVRVADHSYRFTLNGSVINLFNEFFVTDVQVNNQGNPFDPSKLFVYFNQGRRGTLGLSIDF